MHISAKCRLEWFIENYIKADNRKKRVLDVGSYDVNGNNRALICDLNTEYIGLDVSEGPNVDVVMHDPYNWSNIEDESFDYIISLNTFEHIEYPWLTMKEIYKKLKFGGITFIMAPNYPFEHKYPTDCYRYFSDGLTALARWVGLKVIDVSVGGYLREVFHMTGRIFGMMLVLLL